MFYHIDQPCTPSFPTESVKTEHESLGQVRLRCALGLAVINVDAYSLLLTPDLSPVEYMNSWLHCLGYYKGDRTSM